MGGSAPEVGAVVDELAGQGERGGEVAGELALIHGEPGDQVAPLNHYIFGGKVVQGKGLYIGQAPLAGAQAEHLDILGGLLLHQHLHHVDVAGVVGDQRLLEVGLLLRGGFGLRLGSGGRLDGLRLGLGLRLDGFRLRLGGGLLDGLGLRLRDRLGLGGGGGGAELALQGVLQGVADLDGHRGVRSHGGHDGGHRRGRGRGRGGGGPGRGGGLLLGGGGIGLLAQQVHHPRGFAGFVVLGHDDRLSLQKIGMGMVWVSR